MEVGLYRPSMVRVLIDEKALAEMTPNEIQDFQERRFKNSEKAKIHPTDCRRSPAAQNIWIMSGAMHAADSGDSL